VSPVPFSSCDDEDLPTRCVEMLMLSFINGQLFNHSKTSSSSSSSSSKVPISSPNGLNAAHMAKNDESDAAHLEGIYHLLFYRPTFLTISNIVGNICIYAAPSLSTSIINSHPICPLIIFLAIFLWAYSNASYPPPHKLINSFIF
jgi:hypothetical protein